MVQRSVTQPPKGFTVWQAAELGVPHRHDRLTWHRTRVEDFSPDGQRVVVGWPMVQLAYVSVHRGDLVYLGTTVPDDALYVVPCEVVATVLEPQARLVLTPAGPWERMQRREHCRVSVTLVPEELLLLSTDSDPQPLRGTIVDLSAGGIRLRLPQQLRPGDRLAVRFALPGTTQPVGAVAAVRRVVPVERADPPRWDHGCQFERLDRRTEDAIVRFVFQRQRELAKHIREG
ncbi:PilZ domain-containing protein [Thermomicrobium sp. 4228-Ro]|uniref:flagellar brake protein n=1 Tax=Thermomicrobium sp. 4228-Ro TaxID=2993937 RepID=UPI0022497C34|nr:PilZ domain-containing protein [Thermomicrobium sp. 4228-Ro]MCX2728208.1 PilZ domain-containing protein [Thermomicrobium sp. 4228-Ro]